jgi:hypothetical protein
LISIRFATQSALILAPKERIETSLLHGHTFQTASQDLLAYFQRVQDQFAETGRIPAPADSLPVLREEPEIYGGK